MKKPVNKEVAKPKQLKVAAKKKTLPPSKKKMPKSTKARVYPAWTSPEHLSEKDRNALKRLYELFTQGRFEVALNFASAFETIVREEIPPDIWVKIGGKLNDQRAGVEDKSQPEHSDVTGSETPDESAEPVEINFNSADELKQLLLTNRKVFFGDNVIFFKDKKKSNNDRYPDKFLLDFTNPEKPRLFLLEVVLHNQDFYRSFLKITRFFSLLINNKNHEELICRLVEIYNSSAQFKAELRARYSENVDFPGLLLKFLENKPLILLVTNGDIAELSLLVETYIMTWGKAFKVIVIRKFSNGDETTFPMTPPFAEVMWGTRPLAPLLKATEADHLLPVSETVRNIYTTIKDSLIEADSSVEFNPKNHYISVRKKKNLAFFHIRKKAISLVVMNPEEDTRKRIKHHVIKSLPASVQKFWNGPSCTVVIENSTNLGEVMTLLKKLIAIA
jgi:predicted transport protein